eukprot:CAMPEP_0198216092 /NCGR_PEP_ID=MMETSP1445-20131203/54766_1 /TAXON_ID=36898 /ORGANISM="Pyramimonas sp., Strain CCMP2087" /LENGTH=213 /DNA_ID=CAMNT_0043892151 /DNA_START=142 /DNA_END=782 /DNA_ORIENTATION=+
MAENASGPREVHPSPLQLSPYNLLLLLLGLRHRHRVPIDGAFVGLDERLEELHHHGGGVTCILRQHEVTQVFKPVGRAALMGAPASSGVAHTPQATCCPSPGGTEAANCATCLSSALESAGRDVACDVDERLSCLPQLRVALAVMPAPSAPHGQASHGQASGSHSPPSSSITPLRFIMFLCECLSFLSTLTRRAPLWCVLNMLLCMYMSGISV